MEIATTQFFFIVVIPNDFPVILEAFFLVSVML